MTEFVENVINSIKNNGETNSGDKTVLPEPVKWGIRGFLGFVALVVVFSSFEIVSAGERGVFSTFGRVDVEPLGEGLHFKVPFVHSINIVDVQTQKIQTPAAASSKDMQKVQTQMTLNYNILPASAALLYQGIGYDYQSRVIAPAIQESLKAATAKFEAADLIQKRQEVSDMAEGFLRDRLSPNYINVTAVSIEDFQFSESFDSAIEAKVKAKEDALRAENELQSEKAEAAKKVIAAQAIKEEAILKAEASKRSAILTAEGKATAVKLNGDAVRKNPEYLKLMSLQIEQTKASGWGR